MTVQSQSTTEELIVQYLDGELVREELEAVLFERLAQSNEARILLREHLVLRGAIRASAGSEMFELSEAIDTTTRVRLMKILAEVPSTANFAADAAPVETSITGRRLQRSVFRPVVALAALLLAIGGTWFVTHSVDRTRLASESMHGNSTSKPEIQQTPETATTNTSEATISNPSTGANLSTPKVAPKVIIHNVVHYVPVAAYASNIPAKSVSPSEETKTEPTKDQPVDTRDMMISRRWGKIIKASNDKEIPITSHDRL